MYMSYVLFTSMNYYRQITLFICQNYSIYTMQMSKNDFFKMDAPFWGGVDISRQRARVRVRAQHLGHSFMSFFHGR